MILKNICLFPRFKKGAIYPVLEEAPNNQYVIINELDNIDVVSREYFKTLKSTK